MNGNNIALGIIALVLFAASTMVMSPRVLAQLSVGGIDAAASMQKYGGVITRVQYCTCSYGYAVTVSAPRPAVIHLPEEIMEYEYYSSAIPNTWTVGLGDYSKAGECYLIAYPKCIYYPTTARGVILGTSPAGGAAGSALSI